MSSSNFSLENQQILWFNCFKLRGMHLPLFFSLLKVFLLLRMNENEIYHNHIEKYWRKILMVEPPIESVPSDCIARMELIFTYESVRSTLQNCWWFHSPSCLAGFSIKQKLSRNLLSEPILVLWNDWLASLCLLFKSTSNQWKQLCS